MVVPLVLADLQGRCLWNCLLGGGWWSGEREQGWRCRGGSRPASWTWCGRCSPAGCPPAWSSPTRSPAACAVARSAHSLSAELFDRLGSFIRSCILGQLSGQVFLTSELRRLAKLKMIQTFFFNLFLVQVRAMEECACVFLHSSSVFYILALQMFFVSCDYHLVLIYST